MSGKNNYMYYKEPYINLCNAILLQAVNDKIKAEHDIAKYPYYPVARKALFEINSFFASDYAKVLFDYVKAGHRYEKENI